tara:strand:+ start:119 stop:1183 length:1065 start_codon:yes stop_codon:yes gene_type:complete
MDIVIEKLHNENDTGVIKYTDVILDLHKSRKPQRGKYVNYIVHAINKGILEVDKLFYKSVISCVSVDQCFAVGLFLRMGAKLDRFYNGKNIAIHVADRFYNYNEELFVFLTTMFLLKGLTYNDFADQISPNTIGDYFKSKSIEIFFPKNIRLANQRLMNLFMDDKLTKDYYSYQTYELVENLNINLIHKKVVDQETKNCEDILVQEIIDSSSFNLLMAAFESSYPISYFSIERICTDLRKANKENDVIIAEQLLEMLHYLEKKKIYIDEYQYTYIKDIDSNFKIHPTKNINIKIKELLEVNMKENEDPLYTLTKLKFLPSYVYDLDDTQLENIKYKAIHYRIGKSGIEKVLNRI